MSLDLGDNPWATAAQITVKQESDGSGSAGDFVTLNASDQVTPTAASDADIFGVLTEDSPSAGEDVSVAIFGPVIANCASGVAAGNVVEGSATSGQAAANGQGMSHQVDEGGTAVYRLSMGNPRALIDAGGTLPDGTSLGTNEGVVMVR